MTVNTATTPVRHLTAVPDLTPSGCPIPWCILDHSDPIEFNCHVAGIDFASGLGISIGASDGGPATVQAMWDWQAHIETVHWTPTQVRGLIAVLAELADAAEAANEGGVL